MADSSSKNKNPRGHCNAVAGRTRGRGRGRAAGERPGRGARRGREAAGADSDQVDDSGRGGCRERGRRGGRSGLGKSIASGFPQPRGHTTEMGGDRNWKLRSVTVSRKHQASSLDKPF